MNMNRMTPAIHDFNFDNSAFIPEQPAQTPKRGHERVEFFDHDLLMTFKSKEAGRPIYEAQTHIRFFFPGNTEKKEFLATEAHKAKYPQEYEAYKQGKKPVESGTPLYLWPHPEMTSGLVKEWAHFNILTVEDLSEASYAIIKKLGPLSNKLQKEAKLYLDRASGGNGTADVMSRLEAIEAENLRLKHELESMSKRYCEETGKEYIPAPSAAKPKRKRGRPRKKPVDAPDN